MTWVGCGRVVAVAVALALIVGSVLPDTVQAAQTAGDEGVARVRVVHGVAAAGPLDVYIDGSIALIGIVFPEVSADLHLAGGEHQLAVVASGASPDEALVAGALDLAVDGQLYITLIGTSEAPSVGLFAIDRAPLDEGRARFRVINGVADSGEITPAFSGGEALSAPLGFGDATEYAAIDAGVYDLDMLDTASGAILLSLPQTPFAEGTATDIILVGQISDGTLLGIVEAIAAPLTRAAGQLAQIVAGTCADPQGVVADLGLVRLGQGETVGAADGPLVANGFALAAAPFATLIGAPHAIAVVAEGGTPAESVACGGIGGQLTDAGALAIPLAAAGQGDPAGIAVLAPGLENPDATGVSIFLISAALSGPVGTPVAGSG